MAGTSKSCVEATAKDKSMKLSARLGRNGLLVLLIALAVPLCAGAQAQQSDPYDPYNSGGVTGATGLQPHSGAADTGSVSSHAGEGKPLQFKSQTTVVQVPVVVTDKAGNHLHGLTKDDFKVLENGKAQKIASFEEVVPAASEQPAASPLLAHSPTSARTIISRARLP